MPFSASEVHYPFKKGSDGILLKPQTGLVFVPGVQPALGPQYFQQKKDDSQNSNQYSNLTLFNATCLATDVVGALVYATNGLEAVTTADSDLPNPVVGMIISKKDDTHCVVQRYGPVYNVVTGLKTQVRYFLHHSGTLFEPPFDGTDVRFVQQVGYALSPTVFFIQPTGTVIMRDPSGNDGTEQLALRIGSGAPTDGESYPLQDLYLDLDSGAVYFSPPSEANQSNVYVGHGAPDTSNLGPPQDVYYDQDAQAFYVQGDASGVASELITGHGPPTGSATGTGLAYYFDVDSQSLYPQT